MGGRGFRTPSLLGLRMILRDHVLGQVVASEHPVREPPEIVSGRRCSGEFGTGWGEEMAPLVLYCSQHPLLLLATLVRTDLRNAEALGRGASG